jgi:gluconokinase
MGVSGAGKTTVGRLLAQDLNFRFYDADDFHPPANVAKMRDGQPLNDEDRQPWLMALRRVILESLQNKTGAVIACSALKKSYRDLLKVGPEVRLVYLKGGPELIRRRLAAREGHFMPPQLLASQFAALEEPDDAVIVEIDAAPAQIAAESRRRLRL